MTPLVTPRTRWMLLAIGIGALAIYISPAFGRQDKIDPKSDYQYRKDYAQVDGIMKEADPQKRADMLLAFVKEHPESRMIPYVSGYYSQIVATHAQAGAWAKVVEMNEAFLKLAPEDKAATGSLVGAYFQTQNFAKAAEVGEKLYASTPDKAVAYILAKSYLQLKNMDKFLPYAEKVVSEFPMEQCYDLALPVAGVYAARKDLAKASEYAAKVMGAFGEKVPQGVPPDAWKQSRSFAYSLIGANAYEKKDYAKAIEFYEKASVAVPQADEPYYFVGMSKWRNQDLEGAITAFAKVAVLNKNFAKKAQEYLEQLYKPLHNNTLDGLDQVLAKARAELGISG
jgi:tetratricopeptide (TPR) repeat protein